MWLDVIGFVEGADTIFLYTDVGMFTFKDQVRTGNKGRRGVQVKEDLDSCSKYYLFNNVFMTAV